MGVGLIEVGFRIKYGNSEVRENLGITLQFWPYVMTGQEPYHHYRQWFDQLRKKTVTADLYTNNAGFPDSFDFDIAKRYQKQAEEKVVLLTGGSTAFGVGASSNSTLTHEILATVLNSAQSD